MDLLSCIKKYPKSVDCLAHFKMLREKAGIICVKCGCDKHTWLADCNLFECNRCKSYMRIKTGTVMENSVLPIKYWYLTVQILTSAERAPSANELQKMLRFPEYEQVCEMLNQLTMLQSKSNGAITFEGLLFACTKKQTDTN